MVLLSSFIFSLLLVTFGHCDEGFRFARHYADHMVLQRAPQRAVLWGFGEENTMVEISISGKTYTTIVTKDWRGLNVWKVILDPFHPGGPYRIEGTSTADNNIVTISINDVLFGDVWLCGGQSNMQFTVNMAFSGQMEIAMSSKYPQIRSFTVNRKFSNTTVPEFQSQDIQQQWSVASNESVGGGAWQYFSAVCWMFARRLFDLNQIPLGLISSNYGGTCVETWSSPDTLAVCGAGQLTFNHNSPSALWNSMIYPLLNTTIHGVLWYQGEHNAIFQPELYNCTFPAMIAGWRKEWYQSTNKNTDPYFPFGFVQLGALGPDETRDYFALIRWKQTAEYGYVPNPKQLNTFMAVAMDLPDNKSPYASIHPRDKADVADRLILGARAIINRESIYWTGPIFDRAEAYHLDEKTVRMVVLYKVSSLQVFGIEVRNNIGFEVNFGNAVNWTSVYITSFTKYYLSLTVPITTRSAITGLRYAWSQEPCLFKKCAVYSAKTNLPSPPFISHGPFTKDTSKVKFERHFP